MKGKKLDPGVEDRVRRIMEQVESRVRETLYQDVRPLHEIESDVDKIGDFLKERLTKEVVDGAGSGYATTRMDCSCGFRAKYCGIRSRQLITLHGRITVNRSYYYCEGCHKGFCPTDDRLDLGSDECSRTVKAFAARVSSYLPFQLAAEELRALRRIDISTTTVQRHAKKVGAKIGEAWDALGEQHRSGLAPPSGLYPRRLFEAMDAAKCHVGGGWRDVKIAAAYHRDDNLRVSYADYYASLENSTEFGKRLGPLVHIAGGDNCTDRQMLGDGAPWIWTETTKNEPTAKQTLDNYHLIEHVNEFAKVRFRSSAKREAWVNRQQRLFLIDRSDLVVQDITEWNPSSNIGNKSRRKLIDYITEHQDRMNYMALRKEGYDIGSGLIESSCQNAVKNRMARAGMRWEEPGAAAVLHLSTFWRSDRDGSYMQYTN